MEAGDVATDKVEGGWESQLRNILFTNDSTGPSRAPCVQYDGWSRQPGDLSVIGDSGWRERGMAGRGLCTNAKTHYQSERCSPTFAWLMFLIQYLHLRLAGERT